MPGRDAGTGGVTGKPKKRGGRPRGLTPGTVTKFKDGTRSRLGLPAKLPQNRLITYAISKVPGGKHAFFDYARQSGIDSIKSVVAAWDALSNTDKRYATVEDLCEKVGVIPRLFFAEVTAIAIEMNNDVSNLVAAAFQPRIVEKSIKTALTTDGFKDREMQLQHSGFAPTPKGSTINVIAAAQAKAAAGAGNENEAGVPDFESLMMSNVAVLRGDEVDNVTEKG